MLPGVVPTRATLAKPGCLGQNPFVSPHEPHGRPRLGRSEAREVVELKRWRTQHPELASAVDMQLELIDLHRRVQTRLLTPMLQRDPADIQRRLVNGQRLVDFDDLPIDWSEFRLIFRQTAEILHRAGAIEDSDHASLQSAIRTGVGVDAQARDYYQRTSRPDRYQPPPASQAAIIDEVLALALKPFLARCAEAWTPRLDLSAWTNGWCPLCGMSPDFATLTSTVRVLICGRCTGQWPYPANACPFCEQSGPGVITSFASRDGRYRVYGCNRCRKYLKAYETRGASRPVLPVVDTIATLPLDAAAIQQGYDG
jgi:hypothetical protein